MELKKALVQQQKEINDWAIYTKMAEVCKDERNAWVFTKIAQHMLGLRE